MTTEKYVLYLKNITTKRVISVAIEVNYEFNRVNLARQTGGYKPRRTWFENYQQLVQAILKVNNAVIVRV